MNDVVAATTVEGPVEDYQVVQVNAALAGAGSLQERSERQVRRERLVLAVTVLGIALLVAGFAAALVQPALDADYAQGVPPGGRPPLAPALLLSGVCVLTVATVGGFLVHAGRLPDPPPAR